MRTLRGKTRIAACCLCLGLVQCGSPYDEADERERGEYRPPPRPSHFDCAVEDLPPLPCEGEPTRQTVNAAEQMIVRRCAKPTYQAGEWTQVGELEVVEQCYLDHWVELARKSELTETYSPMDYELEQVHRRVDGCELTTDEREAVADAEWDGVVGEETKSVYGRAFDGSSMALDWGELGEENFCEHRTTSLRNDLWHFGWDDHANAHWFEDDYTRPFETRVFVGPSYYEVSSERTEEGLTVTAPQAPDDGGWAGTILGKFPRCQGIVDEEYDYAVSVYDALVSGTRPEDLGCREELGPCCEAFDCDDASSRPDPQLCGSDYTVCEAIEDCCGLPIKECFAPEQPSDCPPYDPKALEASGTEYWVSHFEEQLNVSPIMGLWESDDWPASTGALGLAGLAFERVAVVAAPIMVAVDFMEAASITINNADDGYCQCESGAALRSNALSHTQSPRHEVYCWRPTGDPGDPDAASCQTEWAYTDCVYEDEVTPVGETAVLNTDEYMCDCGIYPQECGVTGVPGNVYCCEDGSNFCRCHLPGSPTPHFAACVDSARAICDEICSPDHIDCRERDDARACPLRDD